MSVEYALRDGVAVLTVQYPPVNALSLVVRQGLMDGISKALADDEVRAIVIRGGGSTFIAGADISEFGTDKSRQGPRLQDIQHALETSAKPTIAAIHGTALGGGFEIALACHARAAVASAKVGLPEVKLGLLPGAGGTVRTPRVAGPEIALQIITSGEHVPAEKALSYGLIDGIVEDLEQSVVEYAKALVAKGAPTPVIERTDKITGVDSSLFKSFLTKQARKFRGQMAPVKIVECVEAACTKTAADALAFESARFQELFESDQRKALIHYFFAEREARKVPGITATPKPIRSAAVIGAGTMGGGIAMVFANAGMPVHLVDVSQEALDRGMETIRKNYDISVGRGSMPQTKADKSLSLISTATDYADFADADIVIEAVFEKMDLKKAIFTRLDAVMKPGAILATNTSSLDIDEIASATKRPEDVIGVHFFSPANVMKLQENIRGAKSSEATVATVMALGKTLGKNVVLAGNCDGFIGNRMLQYYTGEAEFLLEQGATPEQIDRVAEKFGMPMGPISMRDMSGLDVGVLVRAARIASLPKGERLSPILERLVEAGRLGQKNGRGFYRYEGREKFNDPEAVAIFEQVSKDMGVNRRTFTDEELEFRLFAPLVNEGAKELEDGTAIRASDIDVAWVNGYGFPAHKGGPMFWGEQVGLKRVYDAAVEAAKRNGPRWAPSKLLERLAKEGKGWASVAPASKA